MRRAGAANNDDDGEPDYARLVNELDFEEDLEADPNEERSNRQSGASQERAHASAANSSTSSPTAVAHPDPRPSTPSTTAQPNPTIQPRGKYPPSIEAAIAKAAATNSPIVLDPLDEFPMTRFKPSHTEEARAARVAVWKSLAYMRKNGEYMEEVRRELGFEYILGPPPCDDLDSEDEDEDEQDTSEGDAAAQASARDIASTALHGAPETPDDSLIMASAPQRSVGHLLGRRPVAPSPSLSTELSPTVPRDHPCLTNPHPIYSFQQCTAPREKAFYEPFFHKLRHTGLGLIWGALVSRLYVYEEVCGFKVRPTSAPSSNP